MQGAVCVQRAVGRTGRRLPQAESRDEIGETESPLPGATIPMPGSESEAGLVPRAQGLRPTTRPGSTARPLLQCPGSASILQLLFQDLFFHQTDIRVTSRSALQRQQNKDANKPPAPAPGATGDARLPPRSPHMAALNFKFHFPIAFQ